MIQPIYLYGSEVLRKVAEPLDLDKKEEIASLIADLSDTLAKSDGVGLAAPQIGVSRRALIVDAGEVDGDMQYLKGFRRVMINPVVVSESPSMC
ncbi:MAG: peptide deformylase, partial [Bacteroidales bacterium]|nr:peptide deformylase [Bacteroidales bacterium]